MKILRKIKVYFVITIILIGHWLMHMLGLCPEAFFSQEIIMSRWFDYVLYLIAVIVMNYFKVPVESYITFSTMVLIGAIHDSRTSVTIVDKNDNAKAQTEVFFSQEQLCIDLLLTIL